MKILIIDGQGGKIGKALIEGIKKQNMDVQIYAVGTNGIATSTMIKAGADYAATGENASIVHSRDADIIMGPSGIVIADSLMGELSPSMAVAIGQSKAHKILLPINKCGVNIVGLAENTTASLIEESIKIIKNIYEKQK